MLVRLNLASSWGFISLIEVCFEEGGEGGKENDFWKRGRFKSWGHFFFFNLESDLCIPRLA